MHEAGWVGNVVFVFVQYWAEKKRSFLKMRNENAKQITGKGVLTFFSGLGVG